ncbi:MAG: hypothetical protein U0838_02770 [Chloroflexota bacterium]
MHRDERGERSSGNGLFALGAAIVAVACCFGVSLLAAAGGAGLLAIAGAALPVAALIAIGGWAAWHLAHSRQGTGEP